MVEDPEPAKQLAAEGPATASAEGAAEGAAHVIAEIAAEPAADGAADTALEVSGDAASGIEIPFPRPLARVSEAPAAAAPPLRPLARPVVERVPVRPRPRGPAARRVALQVRAGGLEDAPPEDFAGLGELGCLAVAIYHEARDQPLLGQRGVAAVILRRAALPRWGETVCNVVQPVQFSFLTGDRGFPPIDEPDAWRVALAVAVEALTEGPPSTLGNADHYHATWVAPVWRGEMRKVARIGEHIFYSDPRSLILERRAEGDRPDDIILERAPPPLPRPGAI